MPKGSMPTPAPFTAPEITKPAPLATPINTAENQVAARRAQLISQSKKRGRKSTISAGYTDTFETSDSPYGKLLGD